MMTLGPRAHTMEEGAHKYGIRECKKEPCGDGLELEVSDELLLSKIYVCIYKCFYVCTHRHLCMLFVSLCLSTRVYINIFCRKG